MGTDVHMFVEAKTPSGWKNIKIKNLPDDRNYMFFALIGDVRNGYGFAGEYSHDPIKPISKPKGLPDDVSQNVKQESDLWGVDGHSHSWLSVNELNDYDYNQPLCIHGQAQGTIKDRILYFLEKTLPELNCISDTGDDVRIVFWFDS